jgi:hypothetical protein
MPRDTLPALTQAQIAVLQDFARANGRNWKSALRDLWMRAAAGPTLHDLRNTHGPSWLANFRLPKGTI